MPAPTYSDTASPWAGCHTSAGPRTGTVSASVARVLIDSTTSATAAMPSSVATIAIASTGSWRGSSTVPSSPKTTPSAARAAMNWRSRCNTRAGRSRS